MKKPSTATALFLALTTAVLPGCSSTQHPAVPGMTNNVITLKPVELSTVLMALKCQLASALTEIANDRNSNPGNSLKARFKLKNGSGVFSGKTQTVQSDGAKISAVIPFTNVNGTILTPTLGATLSSTGVQETALSFAVSSNAGNADVCTECETRNIEVGTFIQDALIATYRQLTNMPLKGDASYAPDLWPTELKISVNFAVVQKFEAGVTSKIILTSPTTESLGPSLGVNKDQTGIYQLDIKFPFLTDDTGDSRRLSYTISLGGGKYLTVEEPYTQKRYEELRQAGTEVNIENFDPLKPLFHLQDSKERGDQFGPEPEPSRF